MRDADDGVMTLLHAFPNTRPYTSNARTIDVMSDVRAVPLQRERNQRERHARHRRRDEQQKPELRDRVAVERQRAADDADDRLERRRLALKRSMRDRIAAMLDEQQRAADAA